MLNILISSVVHFGTLDIMPLLNTMLLGKSFSSFRTGLEEGHLSKKTTLSIGTYQNG